MAYLGSWAIDDALTFYVNTTRFDTGAATDADAVPTYKVYENETDMSLTGSMALLDSANTAGFYSEAITLSAANGFEVGKQYAIYITTAVNSVTGATHHTFQVGAKVNATQVGGQTASASGTITFPAATLASTTNITAGTVTTATNVTTVNGLAADVITAASMAADASAEIAASVWRDTVAGDFTVAASVGKSVMNGVALGTGLTINGYTGNTVQTGDTFAQIGTAGAGLTDLGGMSTGMKAQVNAEMVDTLATDTYAEPGQATPAATATLAAKLNYLYKMWRNKKTQTATTWNLFNDDAATVDQKATVSDDGVTATKGEIAIGP